ncbi:MAG: alginate lyase family protein [Chloroflexi bacterium]|nr:alginate lyase family protein [Chloroflexota bacterium]
MSSRFTVALKFLRQLGLRPLALFALYKFGLKTGHYKRITSSTASPITNYRGASPWDQLLFNLPSRAQLASILGEDGKASLLEEADEIINGKFHIFGGESTELKLTLNQPLHHWTAYETNPNLITNYKLPTSSLQSPISDIKLLWEPARFGWAFPLGRAYHLTQDDKYAEAFWKYFESFTESNPANLGPHWMNGQEAAIRMMALVWAAHVFGTAPASSPERRGLLIQSITQHAARIPATLVYARSQNNNHLVTEAAAIYTAGLFFKNPKWRALGWKWLNWSFRSQISDYGEYIQHSANYHRVMLQAALWINFIKQDVFPASTSQALARSAHWLFSLLDNASGRTPNLGANDGALIFPLSMTPFNDFRPTVQAAARAFLRTGLPSGVWDEMSLWLGLNPTTRVTDSDAYLSDNLRGQNSWGYLRASRFKSRLSHMDQLHFDLWWRGLNIAQDAGTYLYNAASPWDNPLVTTRVHNTVTVDGRGQMTRSGRFLVLDWFPAYSKSAFEPDENILQRIIAYHKGYRGVRHERTVTIFTDDHWLVEDKMISRRPHVYRLHWLLPDWEWKLEEKDRGVELQLNSPHGWVKLLSRFETVSPDLKFHITLARAGELIYGSGEVLPFEGWVSPTYGQKIPALSLALNVTSDRTVLFFSQFNFPK